MGCQEVSRQGGTRPGRTAKKEEGGGVQTERKKEGKRKTESRHVRDLPFGGDGAFRLRY
jgi:hypothetical protein